MPKYATEYDPQLSPTGDELVQVVDGTSDKRMTTKQIARLAWVEMDQSTYDALDPPDPDILYVITD